MRNTINCSNQAIALIAMILGHQDFPLDEETTRLVSGKIANGQPDRGEHSIGRREPCRRLMRERGSMGHRYQLETDALGNELCFEDSKVASPSLNIAKRNTTEALAERGFIYESQKLPTLSRLRGGRAQSKNRRIETDN